MRRNMNSLPLKLLAHSAWFAAIVGALSLVFSAYVYTAPTTKIPLKDRVNFIRAAVSPRTFLLETFPKDSPIAQSLNKPSYDSEYRLTTPQDEDLRRATNNLVVQINGGSYETERFEKWLNAESPLGVKWSALIDDANAKNDNNLKLAIRSFLSAWIQIRSATSCNLLR
jgi:hypothetical protein